MRKKGQNDISHVKICCANVTMQDTTQLMKFTGPSYVVAQKVCLTFKYGHIHEYSNINCAYFNNKYYTAIIFFFKVMLTALRPSKIWVKFCLKFEFKKNPNIQHNPPPPPTLSSQL